MLAVATNMVILAVGIVYSAGQARGIRPNSPSIFGILPSTNAGSPDVTGLSGYIEVCEHFCIDGPTKGSGEMMDKQLKSMIKELGEAINGSLSDSEQIAEVISRIKEGGYDVFVVLEATIAFNERPESEEEGNMPVRSSADFTITTQDVQFLKELRISVEEAG